MQSDGRSSVCRQPLWSRRKLFVCINQRIRFVCMPLSHSHLPGEYSLYVAMGLSVEFTVSYNNHTFVRRSNPEIDRLALRGVGFTLIGTNPTEDEYFEIGAFNIANLDFEDTTTVVVNVELAGGRCNRTLGQAVVNVKRDLCPLFLRPITIDTFRTPIVFPAAVFSVEFGEMQGSSLNFNLEVGRYLEAARNNSAVIDLRNATVSSTDVFTTVRFEYHPAPTLKVEFGGLSKTSCTDTKQDPQWVIASGFNTTVTIYAKEEFPSTDSCDDIVGNITVTSFLGEDVPDTPVSLCRGGCNLALIADTTVNAETRVVTRSRSRVMQNLLIGLPVLFAPYTKNLVARMQVLGHKDVLLEVPVVVIGDRVISKFFSVQVPEYLPLMVLHDPPGGCFVTHVSLSFPFRC
jgi:hypothetical protein